MVALYGFQGGRQNIPGMGQTDSGNQPFLWPIPGMFCACRDQILGIHEEPLFIHNSISELKSLEFAQKIVSFLNTVVRATSIDLHFKG